ncbi:UNVERIFIED_CONTAM: hypothetical protein NCL1_45619 [Trichonephila clavipes]
MYMISKKLHEDKVIRSNIKPSDSKDAFLCIADSKEFQKVNHCLISLWSRSRSSLSEQFYFLNPTKGLKIKLKFPNFTHR